MRRVLADEHDIARQQVECGGWVFDPQVSLSIDERMHRERRAARKPEAPSAVPSGPRERGAASAGPLQQIGQYIHCGGRSHME
jgi:hypothetical protein